MVQRAANAPIRFGLLPELIGYRLRLAQLAVFKDFCEHVGGPEMTPTLFGVLALVEANPGMTQAQLAEAIQLDRSSIGGRRTTGDRTHSGSPPTGRH